jgi:maleylacetoacetate isomerase
MSSVAGETSAAKKARVASDGVTLHSYWRSSCSWRVRIALALKGVDYEYRAVHLVQDGGMQLKDEYAALNPMKEVPTLVIDGHTLTQSLAIIEYIDETRGGTALMPVDPLTRARVRALSDIVAQGIQAVQNLRVLLKAMTLVAEDEKTKTKIAWGKHWIQQGFVALERMLEHTAGTYCVGDAVTMADLCLVPQVYNARRFKVDLSAFPLISRIDATLSALPAFVAAHPDKQPDAQ